MDSRTCATPGYENPARACPPALAALSCPRGDTGLPDPVDSRGPFMPLPSLEFRTRDAETPTLVRGPPTEDTGTADTLGGVLIAGPPGGASSRVLTIRSACDLNPVVCDEYASDMGAGQTANGNRNDGFAFGLSFW